MLVCSSKPVCTVSISLNVAYSLNNVCIITNRFFKIKNWLQNLFKNNIKNNFNQNLDIYFNCRTVKQITNEGDEMKNLNNYTMKL